ncbi:39S ribosomal protein L32, mitochondrial-like [Lytechinus variegatus]|uniref:39S ribosomal protein L32, mitochondrial-like n=1 Tax=Lytechinus variegatus TaxID=7654 RepID=UPI001BB17BDB|nr:39S ribosomal protein L32, mitochondrial-like [Lytechinus variegatus]
MAISTGMLRHVNISIQNFLKRFNAGVAKLFSKDGLVFEPVLAIPALRGLESQNEGRDPRNDPNSIQELFDGFLWAVPKHRRSIQRNRGRRRALDKRVSYNTSLVPCETCGNLRQFGYLCGHCLVKIREETKQIQEEMFGELDKDGVLPDKENVVIYEGETLSEDDVRDKHPIELRKKRPAWFSKDLIQDWKKW